MSPKLRAYTPTLPPPLLQTAAPSGNWTAGTRTDLLRFDDVTLVPPLYIKSWRGAVYAAITTAGDYYVNMTLELGAALDPNATLSYTTAAFYVQVSSSHEPHLRLG
jgi:hypothetical protein